jgi:hypothetical protein
MSALLAVEVKSYKRGMVYNGIKFHESLLTRSKDTKTDRRTHRHHANISQPHKITAGGLKYIL